MISQSTKYLIPKRATGFPNSRLCRRSFASSLPQPVELEYDVLAPHNGDVKTRPLVIIHGLFGSKRNWLSLSKAFHKDLNRAIYSLDLRNSGSSPHARPMTYEAMASDILHFLQKHGLKDVSLLGHSMGGKAAMSVALSPELPDGLLTNLIVADIAPSRGALSPEFRSYTEAMKKIQHGNVKSRKEAQDILSEYEKDSGVRAFLLTNLNIPSSGDPVNFKIPIDILDEAISDIGDFPYAPDETGWHGRTLFIKGTKSKYINRHNIPTAKALFPNSRLEELDASHWVHAEKPHEFKKLVVDFIDDA